jgi:hypothetical protein
MRGARSSRLAARVWWLTLKRALAAMRQRGYPALLTMRPCRGALGSRAAKSIGAFAPALRVLTPVLCEFTQFVWRVTRRPICQHLGDADTEQDARCARLKD